MYTGLHTDLNFSLPAGDVNRNYTSKYIQIHQENFFAQTEFLAIKISSKYEQFFLCGSNVDSRSKIKFRLCILVLEKFTVREKIFPGCKPDLASRNRKNLKIKTLRMLHKC